MRYKVEHEKRNSTPTSNHELFHLLNNDNSPFLERKIALLMNEEITIHNPRKKVVECVGVKASRWKINVFAVIIGENFDTRSWIENGKGFAIHLSTWRSGAKASDVSAADWRYQTQVKNNRISHMCCYDFFQGLKSLHNTAARGCWYCHDYSLYGCEQLSKKKPQRNGWIKSVKKLMFL